MTENDVAAMADPSSEFACIVRMVKNYPTLALTYITDLWSSAATSLFNLPSVLLSIKLIFVLFAPSTLPFSSSGLVLKRHKRPIRLLTRIANQPA